MKTYEVIVDYVTTATIVVNARNAESAERKAWRYVHTQEGFKDYINHAYENVAIGLYCLYSEIVPGIDGFDIPCNAEEWSGCEDEIDIDLREER